MKKLWFAFLALLLGCSLAWATPKTVTIHGSITAPANLPSNTLTIWVGTAGDSPIQLKEIPLPATEFRFTAELNSGASVYFNLGFSSGEDKELAIYPSQDDKRSQDYFFETPEGQKNRYWLTLADWDNPFATEPEGGWDDYTFDLKIVAKGGPKASLVGRVDIGTGAMNCLQGVTVTISDGAAYSASTTTKEMDYDKYYSKLGCMSGYGFEDLALGTYTLTYSKDGYVTQTKQVEITKAEEIVVDPVTLEAKPEEYIFEGYIKYRDADDNEFKVEGAKITAYDGDGEDASVVGEPVYTDENGYWSMTVACKAYATFYFFAEHPNIDVPGRKSAQAIYASGNLVDISCDRSYPEGWKGLETCKVRQVEVTVNGETKPGVEISWTWPQVLIDNYKKSENDAEGFCKITSIKIKRPIGMEGLTMVGEIQPSGYELPATSFIDGKNPTYLLEAGKTYTYTIEISYSHPFMANAEVKNDADNRLKITLQAGTVAHDSVYLTLTANNSDWGTVEGTGKYEKNDQVVIRAKAKKGYLFKEWQKGGQTYATAAEYKVILTQDLTLEAVFEERPPIKDSVTITLTPNNDKWGTVEGAGRYAKGEEVTITAAPIAGYAFKQWKAGNMVLSSKKAYTFIANTDSSITAVFDREVIYRGMINCKAKQIAAGIIRLDWAWPQELKDDYKTNDNPNGIYVISQITIGRKVPNSSTSGTFTIRPEEYKLPQTYYVDNSTEENPLEVGTTYIYFLDVTYAEPAAKTVSVNNNGSDPNLEVTVSGSVEPVQHYTLTISANEDEMGFVSITGGNNQFMEGDEVTVTAIAKPGYIFKCWKEGDDVVHNAATYTFTMPNRNRTLVAEFVAESQVEKVTLALTCDEAKGTVSGDGEFAVGTEVTARAVPKEGYVFEAWKENGEVVYNKPIYTFVIMESHTLEAVFAKKSENEDPKNVTIKLEVNDKAMGTVSGGGEYAKGTQVEAIATANTGCFFKGWQENGKMLDAGATYKFMATTDRTLMAVFSDTVEVTLLVNNSDMGTVTGGGKYKIGSKAIVKATPKEGYIFQSWMDGQTEVSTEAEYTLEVLDNTTLKAMFAPKPPAEMVQLTLEVNDEDMGTVSGEGEYEKGTRVTVKATPKEGYDFRAWKRGDEEVSTDAEYTFVINEAQTLTAVFVTHIEVSGIVTLSLDVNDEAMGSVFGAGKYKKGVTVKVRAFANEGYVFQAWKEGEKVVSTDAEYTFTIEADRTLMAVFVEGEANEDVELAAWDVFAENGRIVLHSNTDCRYEVYTLGGVLVKQGEMHTNACRIAVDNGGLYIVRRISATGISVRKVVVR